MNAPLPKDEARRLGVLHGLLVLDTPPELVFDDLTRLAAGMLHAPISLVSLVDETRQWFKSRHGLGVESTPRDFAFCAHAILRPDDLFEVQDARADPRFASNPLVTGEPHIRFYAGVPLVSAEGCALGTLNVIDHVPRKLDDQQAFMLRTLARQVVAQLEVRHFARQSAAQAAQRAAREDVLRAEYEATLDSERALRHELEVQRRFSQKLTDVVPSVLYVFDVQERRTVFVNHEVLLRLGYAPAQILGTDPVTDYMHPEDLARFPQQLARIAQLPDGEVAEFNYRMRHADGSWRWFLGRDAVFARRDDGTVCQIVGASTDISVLKASEDALRASEQRFRTLADLSTVGIGAADDSGSVVYVNSTAARIVGVPQDECLGAGWGRHLHPEDSERVQQSWLDAFTRRVQYRDEFRFLHPDGRVVHVLGEARPVPSARPGDICFVTTVVDVTAVKELEQHRQARLHAEQANQAKSAFLARMSHELRTPLNSILGFTQLLQVGDKRLTDPRHLGFVRHVEQAGKHLLELINETLDLARIESGAVSVSLEPVAVVETVAHCVELMREQARALSIALDLTTEHGAACHVLVDRLRLSEIVLNLLSNAIKYNRPGGDVKVRVASEGGHVTIAVTDTGTGLSESQLARLFEPFNRLGAENSKVPGTGLGLAIARHMAELMHGSLDVRSEPGVGSTFTLTVPKAPEAGSG